MLFAGCATTKTVSFKDYRSLQEDLLGCLQDSSQPAIEEALKETESAVLPPYTWPPETCNSRSALKAWPDYEKIKHADCTWFFHPLDRNHSTCTTKWALKGSSWVQTKLVCTKHKNH